MKLLIRDDDSCAFTRTEELVKCYGHIWDHIPVNISVTPFRIPGDDPTLSPQYKRQTRIMPLEENKELVRFLREMVSAGKINIALHGYHHTRPNNLPEYVGETGLLQKTREGKKYLQDLLGCQIDTFVPPNNGIGREGIEALVANNLNLIGLPSLVRPQYRPVTFSNFLTYFKLKYYQIFYKIQYPYVLGINGHKEVTYFSVTPSQTLEHLLFCFKQCEKLNGVFILSTHYHAFDKKMRSGEYIRDIVDLLIEKASSSKNIEFCTYKQLWDQR